MLSALYKSIGIWTVRVLGVSTVAGGLFWYNRTTENNYEKQIDEAEIMTACLGRAQALRDDYSYTNMPLFITYNAYRDYSKPILNTQQWVYATYPTGLPAGKTVEIFGDNTTNIIWTTYVNVYSYETMTNTVGLYPTLQKYATYYRTNCTSIGNTHWLVPSDQWFNGESWNDKFGPTNNLTFDGYRTGGDGSFENWWTNRICLQSNETRKLLNEWYTIITTQEWEFATLPIRTNDHAYNVVTPIGSYPTNPANYLGDDYLPTSEFNIVFRRLGSDGTYTVYNGGTYTKVYKTTTPSDSWNNMGGNPPCNVYRSGYGYFHVDRLLSNSVVYDLPYNVSVDISGGKTNLLIKNVHRKIDNLGASFPYIGTTNINNYIFPFERDKDTYISTNSLNDMYKGLSVQQWRETDNIPYVSYSNYTWTGEWFGDRYKGLGNPPFEAYAPWCYVTSYWTTVTQAVNPSICVDFFSVGNEWGMQDDHNDSTQFTLSLVFTPGLLIYTNSTPLDWDNGRWWMGGKTNSYTNELRIIIGGWDTNLTGVIDERLWSWTGGELEENFWRVPTDNFVCGTNKVAKSDTFPTFSELSTAITTLQAAYNERVNQAETVSGQFAGTWEALEYWYPRHYTDIRNIGGSGADFAQFPKMQVKVKFNEFTNLLSKIAR